MKAVHRQVQTLLEPRLHAVRPFGGTVHGIIRDDCVQEIRSGSPNRSEIGVNHEVENAGVGNLRVVNLNLIRLAVRTRRYRDEHKNHNEQASESQYSQEKLRTDLVPANINAR